MGAPRPVVFVGEHRGRRFVRELRARGWGRMFADRAPTPADLEEPIGFDNGAFSAWSNGRPFPKDRFLRRVEQTVERDIVPRLAVLPDIVAAGRRSLDFSLRWQDSGRLPGAWPWFIAVQDGMAPDHLAGLEGRFAGVFLGGSDDYKTTAATWCEWSHDRGLRFHYARCGTIRKLEASLRIGADSVDTTTLLPRAPRHLARQKFWIDTWLRGPRQRYLLGAV